MKITGIIKKDGFSYMVGETASINPDEVEEIIERIVYKREGNLFNNAVTNSEPAYIVYIIDNPVVRIVPEREMQEIFFDTTKKEKEKTSAAADETPKDFVSADDTDDQAEAA